MSAAESVVERKLLLLVEDHADTRELYAGALRAAGFYVVEASTLAEARSAVRALCPDLVVLDCRLPDGDGLSVLATWRTSRTVLADVPVIVLTACAQREDIDAALLAGADELVPKPCPGNVLALHVKRALDGSRPSSRVKRVTP